MDIPIILLASGLFAIAAILAVTQHQSHQHYVKSESAKLCLQYLEFWDTTKHPNMANFFDLVIAGRVRDGDPRINSFLDIFEEISMLRKDGLITENHVMEMFVNNLKAISANPAIYNYMVGEHDNKLTFENVRELHAKALKWRN